MTDDRRDAIIAQAIKIEEDCERAAIRDALLSTRWNTINTVLGLSATIIAALSALLAGSNHGTGIAAGNWAAAGTAGMASVLAAVLTFLSPSEKAGAFQQYSNKYHALRDRIRLFVAVGALATEGEQLAAEFDKLLQEKREIDADHPILPEWAYEKAKKKIEEKIEWKARLAERKKKAELSSQNPGSTAPDQK